MQKAPLGTDACVLNPNSVLTKWLFEALYFHWAFTKQKAVDNWGQKALSIFVCQIDSLADLLGNQKHKKNVNCSRLLYWIFCNQRSYLTFTMHTSFISLTIRRHTVRYHLCFSISITLLFFPSYCSLLSHSPLPLLIKVIYWYNVKR